MAIPARRMPGDVGGGAAVPASNEIGPGGFAEVLGGCEIERGVVAEVLGGCEIGVGGFADAERAGEMLASLTLAKNKK